jgi:hypothetical protein
MDVVVVRDATKRLRGVIGAWLGVAVSALCRAEAVNAFTDTEPRNMDTMLVLLAGGGVLVVAVAVLAFAIRQLRRESAERRRTYMYRRRGPSRGAGPHAPTD